MRLVILTLAYETLLTFRYTSFVWVLLLLIQNVQVSERSSQFLARLGKDLFWSFLCRHEARVNARQNSLFLRIRNKFQWRESDKEHENVASVFKHQVFLFLPKNIKSIATSLRAVILILWGSGCGAADSNTRDQNSWIYAK